MRGSVEMDGEQPAGIPPAASKGLSGCSEEVDDETDDSNAGTCEQIPSLQK